MHHANSLARCRICRSLPLPADIGKESRSRNTIFAKYLVAAIAVVPDCRSADHDLGWSLQFGERLRNQLCTFDATVTNSSLSSSRPAAGSNVLTGQMNQRV